MHEKVSQWHGAYQRDGYLLVHDVLDTGRLAKPLRRFSTKLGGLFQTQGCALG